MELICISTFDTSGKVKGLTLNRRYQCKLCTEDKVLIIDDSGKPKLHQKLNFISFNSNQLIKDYDLLDHSK
jgi:hypothetical protein